MMADVIFPQFAPSPPGLLPRLRVRVTLTFVFLVVIACAIAGTLLISRALDERRAIRRQALAAAVAGANAFDQEVASVNYLLKGLSQSPALRSGDLEAFYEQLKTTPAPDGAWFVLNDLEGQVLNTLRPFGSKDLPKLSDFPGRDELLNRLHERGWTVSGRMHGVVQQSTVVALSLRIDDSAGLMRYFVTTVLPDARLRKILDDQPVPEGWIKGLLDRELQPIVATRNSPPQPDFAVPPELHAALANAGTTASDGLIEGLDDQSSPILVAYRHSASTNWTSVVETPLSAVDAPIHRVALEIGEALLFLLALGGLAASSLSRHLVQPFDSLTRTVGAARQQIDELSEQLLTLQEEERQHIARELHDSTAQHLVASTINLIRLEKQVKGNPAALETCRRLDALTDTALKELRVFTYLLHPPNLAKEGLKTTLRDFVEGFAARSELAVSLKISGAVDDVCFEVQRCVLRVVQAALSNVSRHADASNVKVILKLGPRRLFVRIADNGHGMAPGTMPHASQSRLGVGIPGMRARLQQFGGALRIFDSKSGVTVLAVVPISIGWPA